MNPEIDVTKFVNIDDKPFDVYIGGKLARHFEPGEIQTTVVYVAQVGAKHLVDRILQVKHGIRDTLKDTPLRQSLFAQILPELAIERNIKPLTPDQEKAQVKEMLAKQVELEKQLKQKDDERENKDKQRDAVIEALQKEIAELKNKPAAKKGGRPPKVVAPPEPTQ